MDTGLCLLEFGSTVLVTLRCKFSFLFFTRVNKNLQKDDFVLCLLKEGKKAVLMYKTNKFKLKISDTD